MIFLSEHNGITRTAQVYRRNTHDDFVVIGYYQYIERASHPFPTEAQAEQWAIGWVNNNEEPNPRTGL